MNYFKCLFFNFLTVFFANYLLPGIEITGAQRLPHLSYAILFAFGLGFLNSLIVLVLKVLKGNLSWIRLGMMVLILNSVSYALLKLFPLTIQILNFEGYLFAVGAVSLGAFVTNFLEAKKIRLATSNLEDPPIV